MNRTLWNDVPFFLKLPAGSGFVFTGKKKHTTACAAGADCVMFIDARAKWDVIPVAKK